MFVGQLTHTGFRIDAPAALDAVADQFARDHYVRFERFVAPPLLHRWLGQLDAAAFTLRVSDNWVGPPPVDLFLDAPEIDCAMEFAMNDLALFGAIERIAGCGHIGSFLANIHRMIAGAGHVDRWHNDVDGARAVGISVNLTSGGYQGGVLQFADAQSRAVLAGVANPTPGDAVLFEISEALVHCVSPLESGTRTVLAGWFMRTPGGKEWREGLLRRLR